MSKAIVLAGAMILAATNMATAIECKTAPDKSVKAKWNIETVGGKTCWFVGDSATLKEELRWPGGAKPDAKKAASAPEPAQKKVETARASENAKSAKPAAAPKPERAQPEKLAAVPQQKIQCQTGPDNSRPGRWRWRQIDGMQCWFVGEHVPKERLEWPQPEQSQFAMEAVIGNGIEELKDVEMMQESDAEPAEGAAPVAASWQIVNPDIPGDLEFLAKDAWIALMKIDLNLGAEFLTSVPTSYWPVLAQRTSE
jgi:hypothetical protein